MTSNVSFKLIIFAGSAAVVFAMRSAGGHAGQAMKLLQQFWRHYSDLG